MTQWTIYGDGNSGNCYKIQLVCGLLGLQYDWVDVDILAGETQTESFLAKNPNGKIPLLQLENGETLSESNAIINYIAAGTELFPQDRFLAAKVQQWQFFEQYSHEPYIAVARFIEKYLGLPDARRAEYDAKHIGGYKALRVMEQQLVKTPFLLGEQLTNADVSLFAYTHVAHEGGFSLAEFPAIQRWINAIQQQCGFVPMG